MFPECHADGGEAVNDPERIKLRETGVGEGDKAGATISRMTCTRQVQKKGSLSVKKHSMDSKLLSDDQKSRETRMGLAGCKRPGIRPQDSKEGLRENKIYCTAGGRLPCKQLTQDGSGFESLQPRACQGGDF